MTRQKPAGGIFAISLAVVLDIVFLLVFWFVAMIAMTAAWTVIEYFANAGHLSASAEPGATAQLLIALSGLYLAISVTYLLRARELTLPPMEMTTRRKLFTAFAAGIAVFLVTLSLMAVLEFFGMASKPGNQEILENLGARSPTVTVFFTVLFAPIFEELFFRGLLFARLFRANFAVAAYLLSSLLFALMHEPSPTNGILDWLLKLTLYGLMGAAFASVCRKTGKLWPAILAHASNNLLGMVVVLLS